MGWDDNGLPTERRVQNYYGVRCDPSLPYDPSYAAADAGALKKDHRQVSLSRQSFVELCQRLTAEDEKAFEALFRRLGLSVDWSHTYDDHRRPLPPRPRSAPSCATSAAARPTPPRRPPCGTSTSARPSRRPSSRTASSPAPTTGSASAGPTARRSSSRPPAPSCCPACVALVAHPDDERYQPLFGTTVTTPLFGVEVPVRAHELADPEKGSGIAMICTFGDTTDVTWWRELDLPVRSVVGRDGRFLAEPPAPVRPTGRTPSWPARTSSRRRSASSSCSPSPATSSASRKPITHPVKFYEKGDRPLEIVTSRQWYLRNGGRDADLREPLLGARRGADLAPVASCRPATRTGSAASTATG